MELENTQRKLSLRNDIHLPRKIWHVATGLGGLFFYDYFQVEQQLMAKMLFVIAIIGFATDLLRQRFPKMNQIVIMLMGPLMRESERNSWSGLPFYALGTSISLFLYPESIALISIFFLVIADPFCSAFGIAFGKHKILGSKSLEGFLACLFASYFIALVYLTSIGFEGFNVFIFCLLAAVFASVAELLSGRYVDDNLLIPVLSGAGMAGLLMVIPLG